MIKKEKLKCQTYFLPKDLQSFSAQDQGQYASQCTLVDSEAIDFVQPITFIIGDNKKDNHRIITNSFSGH